MLGKGMVFVKPVIRLMKSLFTPVAVLFLLYFGWQSREMFKDVFLEAEPWWLAVSACFWVMLHFLSPVFTVVVFRSENISIDYRRAFIIHASRLPAKYLPGGIWHSVSRALDYHRHGYQSRHVASYLVLENLMAAAVTIFIGGFVVSTIKHISSEWVLLSIITSLVAFLVLCVMPWLLNRYLQQLDIVITIKRYILGVCCSIFYWMVAAVSFIFFIKSFPNLDLVVGRIEIGGIYMYSWGVGFLAVFAPQGIGVAEVVSGALLGSAIGIGGTAAFLVGFRIVVLFSDMVAWLFSLIMDPAIPGRNSGAGGS